MKQFFIIGSVLIVTALLGAVALWLVEDVGQTSVRTYQDTQIVATTTDRETSSTPESVVQIIPVPALRPYIPALEGATSTTSTVLIGQIPGTWMFEGSFPVSLYTAEGELLAEGYGQTEEDWMTTEYVSFTIENIDFSEFTGQLLTLVLKKDNPSGIPALDDSETYTFTIQE